MDLLPASACTEDMPACTFAVGRTQGCRPRCMALQHALGAKKVALILQRGQKCSVGRLLGVCVWGSGTGDVLVC
jgi:hypothetical protein